MGKLEFFKKYMKGKVLDVGCAHGNLHKLIYQNGMYGLDIDPNCLIKENFHVGDAQDMPFKNSFFDTVIASELIEHLDNPDKFLWECYRVLKRGGILLLSTPNSESFYNAVTGRYYHKWHKHIFNIFDLTEELVTSGFRVSDIKVMEFDDTQTYINHTFIFKLRGLLCRLLPESLREDILVMAVKGI